MKISDLNVYRGPCEVLRNLTIDIPKGKWTSIIGPNGAGKSSLLQGITNILSTTGCITIDDINVALELAGVDLVHVEPDLEVPLHT